MITKCVDCIYFGADFDVHSSYGYCDLTLPPWLEVPSRRTRYVDGSPTGDGCDLGKTVSDSTD